MSLQGKEPVGIQIIICYQLIEHVSQVKLYQQWQKSYEIDTKLNNADN